MNTETSTLYRVSGNMDQIRKQDLEKDYNWIANDIQANPESPNRFYVMLPIEQARALHCDMKERKMVVLRNWLDN